MGLLSYSDVDRLISLIEKAGLLPRMPELDSSDVVAAMLHDKKVQAQQIRFVLLKEIGDAAVSDEVSLSLVTEVLSA
jgi:3-dehydroquinate synthase